jgi:hypothetical protein
MPHPNTEVWIVDVDVPLVIDVALGVETSGQDQAERIQMAKSIRIDPHEVQPSRIGPPALHLELVDLRWPAGTIGVYDQPPVRSVEAGSI